MQDTLGWRTKFGVLTPSTNTVVQVEYDEMRPVGATNHIARIHIPDKAVRSDKDFEEAVRHIDLEMEAAVDRVMTCRPDHLILGISVESIWGGGAQAADRLRQRMVSRAGTNIGVTQAADAIPAALKALGVTGKVSLLTPYFPPATVHLKQFMDDIDYSIGNIVHLESPGPADVCATPHSVLREGLVRADSPDTAAIVQFGAGLPMGRMAAAAELWLDKPVIAVNVATYWHALRTNGITDRVAGYGQLMERC